MKNSVITMLAALALSLSANAQEVMKVELKNGQIATYNVEDISRFYFEGAKQQEELATDCKISIVDEVVLINEFAIEFGYDTGIENVFYTILKTDEASKYSDDILVAYLLRNGDILPKTTKTIWVYNVDEGMDITVLYLGLNAQGKRGNLYKRHVTTKIAANEPLAEIIYGNVTDETMSFRVEIDNSKVSKYYLSVEVGDDLERYLQLARLGLIWKKNMSIEGSTAQQQCYTLSRDFTVQRPNGEKRIKILTWACDRNGNLSGIISQRVGELQQNSRSLFSVDNSHEEPNMLNGTEKETQTMIDFKHIPLLNIE